MPEEPVAFGLLRDPWRTRARFVRGRLGRLFRAVEDLVEDRIPDRLGEIASQGPRGWVWNREMLGAAVSRAAIDDEGSASLDGEPLDIDALVALEPTFTFDNVARRITRQRLFRVIRAIRQITHERNLDVPWARRGDPRTWIASLVGVDLGDGTSLDTDDLFDAWGRAFVFRPTQRRSFLPAIEGWEVASLGPDGRDGNADDLYDPLARVVPTGSLYADAVGEDALVARLAGVSLGRAWVAQIEEEFGGSEYQPFYEEAATLGPLAEAWASAPDLLRAAPPIGGFVPIASQSGAYLGTERSHRWTLPAERRPYAAVAIAVPREGRPRIAAQRFEAGARIAVRTGLPELLRIGDQLSIPVVVSELEGTVAPELSVAIEGEALEGSLRDRTVVEGGSSTASLVLDARSAGSATIVLTARRGVGDDAETLEVRRHVRVLPGGALIATHTSALLSPGQSLSLVRGEGEIARSLGTTLSIAPPRALDGLPFFVDLERRSAAERDANAAVLAWARALEGSLDAELAARAARAGGRPLVDVCALVALSSMPEHVASAGMLRRRVTSLVMSSDLRERSAMMVALSGIAAAGVPSTTDGVDILYAQLRADGWRALATERSAPSVMARVAAGLLLADADDGPGRALYRSALEALVTNEHGERVVPGDVGRVGDGWIGTLALALAARQLGDDTNADALARAASRELYLLSRTGAEGPFWVLAASVFGAFGGDGPESNVPVEIGGARRELTREQLHDRIEVTPDASVAVREGAPLVVAMESRALRVLEDRHDAAFDARVEGVLGDADRLGVAGARSALELVVTAGSSDVAQPVIEVELPSLASLDAVARGALSRTQAVSSVSDPDRGGVLRIRLAPLARGDHRARAARGGVARRGTGPRPRGGGVRRRHAQPHHDPRREGDRHRSRSARRLGGFTMTRALLVLLALASHLGLAGCGAGPRPTEVTEPWTSGDEHALGIEEPGPTEPSDDRDAAPH